MPTSAAAAAASHLLVPFAGRTSPACRAAVAGLRLPNLETLLTRLTLVHTDEADDGTLSPPHERALAEALGVGPAADGCIAWAAHEAQQSGLALAGSTDAWGVITLCHWQVGMDDVVLGDPAATQISEAESQALLSAAHPLFEDDAIVLHASATPGRWLARGEVFRDLPTASVDRAVGRAIADWSPTTDAARPLRRLQNEMQMLFYTQRVNDQRTARGEPPINSFWLSGTGALPASMAPAAGPAPTVDASLRCGAVNDDGLGWVAAWEALDAGPVAALLAQSAAGAEVVLTLCGDRAARRYTTRQRGFGHWVKSLFGRQHAPDVIETL